MNTIKEPVIALGASSGDGFTGDASQRSSFLGRSRHSLYVEKAAFSSGGTWRREQGALHSAERGAGSPLKSNHCRLGASGTAGGTHWRNLVLDN